MRTKTLVCAALLAAGVATSMAQSNVYSLNIVGYANVPLKSGSGLYNNPLDKDGTNNAANILTTLNNGGTLDQFYLGTFSGKYNIVYYENDLGGTGWFTDPSGSTAVTPPNLPPGIGFLITTTLGAYTNTFVGNVVPAPGTTNTASVASGSSLIGSRLPVGGYVTNAIFNFPNVSQSPASDQFYVNQFIGGKYVTKYYEADLGGDGWFTDPSGSTSIDPPNLSVGEGFFMTTTLGGTTWKQSL